ncbi:trypsin-like cysteine/serine peptidase domain-containing protein [Entophlyctis helioformis]|nr:trypsin-like cysteine/serine peptidase domain-containing protein [Entophlyctis helioformis]
MWSTRTASHAAACRTSHRRLPLLAPHIQRLSSSSASSATSSTATSSSSQQAAPHARSPAHALALGLGMGVGLGVSLSALSLAFPSAPSPTPSSTTRHLNPPATDAPSRRPPQDLNLQAVALTSLLPGRASAAPSSTATSASTSTSTSTSTALAGDEGQSKAGRGWLMRGTKPSATASAHAKQSASFIADAVEQVLDSVVNICVETDTSTLFERKTIVSSGSGFFISTDGMILTNAHVVADMSESSTLSITVADGTVYAAIPAHTVHPSSPSSPPVAWPAVKFGSNSNLRLGDWVMAIGSPLGLQNTVTAGIVSSRARKSAEIGAMRDSRVEYIQTDCVVHSGSSGGPLINLDGEVIGINTTRAESEGITFAIRIDNALDMIRQLVHQGRVTRPWLGIHMVTLSPYVWSQITAEAASAARTTPSTTRSSIPHVQAGVLVTHVDPRSPASLAGLLQGDVIVAVNNVPVLSSQQMLKEIGLRVGEEFSVRVRRCVGVEFDWDGRHVRTEEEDRVIKVVAGELDVFVHGSGGSGPVNGGAGGAASGGASGGGRAGSVAALPGVSSSVDRHVL